MTQPMPPHDPAARLRAAADRLDALCEAASQGPWNHDGPFWHHVPGTSEETALVTTGELRNPVLLGVPEWVRNAPSRRRSDANVRYAAAMHPGVGRALAALLRYAAKHRQATESAVARVLADGPGDGTLSTADDIDDLTPFALALADAVLADGDHRD